VSQVCYQRLPSLLQQELQNGGDYNDVAVISESDVKGLRRKISDTTSHPEIVGDMLRVTLNSDLSKIPFVRF